MAHAGWSVFAGEAIAVAEALPQVSVDISWCGFDNVGAPIATLGVNRVMSGCDLTPNVPVVLAAVRTLGVSEEDEAMVMGGAANEILKLNLQ